MDKSNFISAENHFFLVAMFYVVFLGAIFLIFEMFFLFAKCCIFKKKNSPIFNWPSPILTCCLNCIIICFNATCFLCLICFSCTYFFVCLFKALWIILLKCLICCPVLRFTFYTHSHDNISNEVQYKWSKVTEDIWSILEERKFLSGVYWSWD